MPARTARVLRTGPVVAVLALAACSSAPVMPPVSSAGPTARAAPTAASADPDGADVRSAVSVAASGRARVVVLDPGHNGGNPAGPGGDQPPGPGRPRRHEGLQHDGTSTDAGYAEHASFDVAQRVAQRLTASGVRVVLTRSDDDRRGAVRGRAGRAGEEAEADAVVSIHADGAGSGPARASTWPTPTRRSTPRRAGRVGRWPPTCGTALVAAGFPRSSYIGRDGLSAANGPRRPQPRHATDGAGGVREHAEPGRGGTGVVGSGSGPLRGRDRRRGPAVLDGR